MARIAGVDLPNNKNVEISLTYIYGIGRTISQKILDKANIDYMKKMKDISEDEIAKIREIIENDFKVEGELRTEIAMNIKRLVDIACYRGIRHRKGLPLNGQRTKTNARTRKGAKRTVAGKKKAPTPK